jgi:hypothetical protein
MFISSRYRPPLARRGGLQWPAYCFWRNATVRRRLQRTLARDFWLTFHNDLRRMTKWWVIAMILSLFMQ